MRQAEQGVKIQEFSVGIGFLDGLSKRSLGCGFAVFHKPGGQRPVALARGNRPFAQEDLVFKKWQTTGHHLRVLVMDGRAGCTNIPWAVVAFGNGVRHGVAALATIFHVSQYIGCFVINDIRQNLQRHEATELDSSHDARKRAAVLVPILADATGPRMLLTERAGGLSSHGGEVAFPGGKEDRTDPSLEFTALRENEEELGISPDDVEIVGSLRPFISKHGLLVKPYVGIIYPGIQWRPSPDEVASAFEVPLSYFSNAIPIRVDDISRHGEYHQVPAFEFDGYEIWGLTSMIVVEFMKVGLK